MMLRTRKTDKKRVPTAGLKIDRFGVEKEGRKVAPVEEVKVSGWLQIPFSLTSRQPRINSSFILIYLT